MSKPRFLVLWLGPLLAALALTACGPALTLRRTALLALTVAIVLTRIWFPEHWFHFNNIPPMFALAAPRDLAVVLLAIFLIFGAPTSKTSEPPATA